MYRNRYKRICALGLSLAMLASLIPAAPTAAAETAAAAAIPQEGLIAEYSFAQRPADGKTVENLSTAEGAAKAAVIQNESTAKWEDGALVFSGEGTSVSSPTGTWVSLPDDILSGKESATISIEVKPSAEIVTKNHFLWSIGNTGTDAYWFMNTMVPRTSIKYGGSEKTAAGSALEADRWYQLTAVIDGEAKTLSFYVDGRKVAGTSEASLSLTQVADQSRNTIGLAPYNDPLFKGSVASFRVYGRALTEEEIRTVSDADAAAHGDAFRKLAQEKTKEIQDVTISDGRMTLPDYDGTVTWKSKTADVTIADDGMTAIALQPAKGKEAKKGVLTAVVNLRGQTAEKDVNVTILPAPDAGDDYGYLMVHFIQDENNYKEKIYLDISRGDDPEYWDPLNGGEPVLASAVGTTGIRDPYLTYNPENGIYYIIATDLRVFGGDNAGWGTWQKSYSTKVDVWESKDLISWSEMRQFDVAYDKDGNKKAELGMMWAPEATWVPDYYAEGDGAFVMYWSSKAYSNAAHSGNSYSRILWGATKDFTQETYEYGGTFIDPGEARIDTTIIQENGKTYHITKNETNATIYMQSTTAKEWWKPEAEWTTVQTEIGYEAYGKAEGPAAYKEHGKDGKWYLLIDANQDYRPLVSDDLDRGWEVLDPSGWYLKDHTKHGGVISLTKAQYDAIRSADGESAVNEDLGSVQVKIGSDSEALTSALPQTAKVNLHYNYGTADIPVKWDVSGVDLNTMGEYEITGEVQTIGANRNQWVGKDGSEDWRAEEKQLYSSTAITVKAAVEVVEEIQPAKPVTEIFLDIDNGNGKNEWIVNAVQFVYDRGIMTGLKDEKGQMTSYFGPEFNLSRAQFAVILYRMENEPEPVSGKEKNFFDVKYGEGTAWYYKAVQWASSAGIVNGYEKNKIPTGYFGPADMITREQLATMLYRYALYRGDSVEEKKDLSAFPDAEKVSYFAQEAVAWAAGAGILKGNDHDHAIEPQNVANRAQCAAMIQRFVENVVR